jgi:pyrrolysine biosynthesis protein PylD
VTRLIEDWIKDIPGGLAEYDKKLKVKTGYDLSVLGAVAGGIDGRAIHRAAGKIKIAVIPVTTGLGIIGSFAASVAEIASQMGFATTIMTEVDVAGIYQAGHAGYELIMLADDNKFIAVNLKKNRIIENNRATARGYVTALEGAAGGLSSRSIAILGSGKVGSEALQLLRKRGAFPVVYARSDERQAQLETAGWKVFRHIELLKDFELIFDANPAANWITSDMLHPRAWIAAPGVPLSLDQKAAADYADRLIHDYLPIGVAAMIGSVI